MLHDKLKKYRIILASASPRRKQLLHEMGIQFEQLSREIAETYPEGMSSIEIAEYLSNLKASAFKSEDMADNDIIITADTIVAVHGKILGKPNDKKEAFEMLSGLSGNTHEVITAVTLKSKLKLKTFSTVTHVQFKTLSKPEIDFYVEHYKPFDKAGAYGIQEWIGYNAIERIDGSYFNVVGLPTHQLYEELGRFL